MSALVFDRISTSADEVHPGKRLPSRIAVLFAKAGVTAPQNGGKVPIGQVDVALKDVSVTERLRIKAQLRQMGIID